MQTNHSRKHGTPPKESMPSFFCYVPLIMRICIVVAALVLAVVIPFSRPAYTWLRSLSANKQLNIGDGLANPESSSDPHVLLAEANRLYWLNNGPKAAPLYAKAESRFASRGDARNELYAKIGQLRSEAETMSFVDLSRFLSDQLQNPTVRNDPRLRLWCLAAKGYTDIEIDYRAEKQDWLEAQQIAKSLGDDRWATRASGELGIIAFLEGNSGRAAKLLGGALVSTMASGDKGGQIRFLEMLGNGMVEVNRPAEALMFFERAIRIAEADKDCGLPFMAYEGKAQALVAIGRPDDARSVLQDALAKARSQRKQGHEAQLLIVLGKLAAQSGNGFGARRRDHCLPEGASRKQQRRQHHAERTAGMAGPSVWFRHSVRF